MPRIAHQCQARNAISRRPKKVHLRRWSRLALVAASLKYTLTRLRGVPRLRVPPCSWIFLNSLDQNEYFGSLRGDASALTSAS
jgi:hypothetical protein